MKTLEAADLAEEVVAAVADDAAAAAATLRMQDLRSELKTIDDGLMVLAGLKCTWLPRHSGGVRREPLGPKRTTGGRGRLALRGS